MMQMTPAEYVIHVFKGVRATARALERSPSSISSWQKHADKTGRAGYIPRTAQIKILEIARVQGLDITAEDLIFGRVVDGQG